MKDKKFKIYFIPHTHWDKEWYFTKEASSVFLVDNIAKLKKIVNDPESFSHHIYDSQFSIIDDYLEFYPEDYQIIKEMVSAKKLIVGPWYSQPDMFSTSGESLIRNLSYGKHFATKLGFSAKQAYTPDSFGFNSNLPQILKQNECDAIIQWRGVDDSHIGHDVFNKWVGIDGSEVYLYNLYKYGYGLTFWAFNSVYKEWNKENIDELAKNYLTKFKDGSREDLENLKKMNKNNMLCFPFGSDQSPVIEWLPLFVKKLDELDDENEWILSDYDTFIADMIESYGEKINKISGELKYGKYSRTHRTIGSSRYDIKSLNKYAENLLYNVAEPLGILYKKFTGEYPIKIYQKALRFLLESHAHDSLGGSCTDEANSEVLNRIKKAIFMLESQNTLIKKRIVEFLNLNKNDLLIFNLLPYTRDVTNKLKIVTKSKQFKIFESSNEIKYSLIESKYYDRTNFLISDNSQVKDDFSEKGFYIHDVILNVKEVPGINYKILKVVDDEENVYKGMVRPIIEKNQISRDNYEIKLVNEKFIIFDKKNQSSYEGYFEVCQDAGDTYDFSPKVKGFKSNSPIKCRSYVEQDENIIKLIAEFEYEVNADLSSEIMVKQEITAVVSLINNEVNFKITMHNEVKDVRWRFIIDTNQKNATSTADQALSKIKRPAFETEKMKIWESEKWKDMPVAVENFSKFVYVESENGKIVGIKSNSLNEYELVGDSKEKLALTLFRGVSLIGRRDLLFRPGRASGINDYPQATPESNLNKNLTFEFTLINQDNSSAGEVYESLSCFDYYQNQNISDYLWIGQTFWRAKVDCLDKQPQPINLFKNIPKNLVISALKMSYDEKYLVCRVANLGEGELNLSDYLSNVTIYESNALENTKKPLQNILKTNEIKTLLIELN